MQLRTTYQYEQQKTLSISFDGKVRWTLSLPLPKSNHQSYITPTDISKQSSNKESTQNFQILSFFTSLSLKKLRLALFLHVSKITRFKEEQPIYAVFKIKIYYNATTLRDVAGL